VRACRSAPGVSLTPTLIGMRALRSYYVSTAVQRRRTLRSVSSARDRSRSFKRERGNPFARGDRYRDRALAKCASSDNILATLRRVHSSVIDADLARSLSGRAHLSPLIRGSGRARIVFRNYVQVALTGSNRERFPFPADSTMMSGLIIGSFLPPRPTRVGSDRKRWSAYETNRPEYYVSKNIPRKSLSERSGSEMTFVRSDAVRSRQS